jgi:hypothetical protein
MKNFHFFIAHVACFVGFRDRDNNANKFCSKETKSPIHTHTSVPEVSQNSNCIHVFFFGGAENSQIHGKEQLPGRADIDWCPFNSGHL